MTSKLLSAALAAAMLAFSLMSLPANAQAPYPDHTIKLIVPNPPGALPDTIARIIGRQLQVRPGQPVVV